MDSTRTIPVCIIAGGASKRFGSPKGLAHLGGERLLDLVLNRIRSQTSALIAINCSADGPYSHEGLPVIEDAPIDGAGPLIGLYSAMAWASDHGVDCFATCPVDTPFLPTDFLAALSSAGAPAICASLGQKHPITGLWPSALASDLKNYLASGKKSAHGWAEHCGATSVNFAPRSDGVDPFFNINTPADLELADGALASVARKTQRQ